MGGSATAGYSVLASIRRCANNGGFQTLYFSFNHSNPTALTAKWVSQSKHSNATTVPLALLYGYTEDYFY